MPSFLCCLSLSLFVLRLPCSCLVMSCRAGCVLVPNLHLQDKSFRLVAFPGLPFTVAQFGCSVCPFASLVCCLVMYSSSVELLFWSVSRTRPLLNAILRSFALCFVFVGAGFDSPVMFDVLVHPRLR